MWRPLLRSSKAEQTARLCWNGEEAGVVPREFSGYNVYSAAPAISGQSSMLFAVSDVVWQALIAAVVTIILAVMQRRTQNMVQRTADDASAKVDQVKADLNTSTAEKNAKLDNLTQLSEKTHALVNSAMGAQLRLTAETARAKAEVTKDPIDMVAAGTAERLYKEHQVKQAKADATFPETGVVPSA